MRLGTRQSVLALAQSGHVARALGPDVSLVGVTTEGDRLVDVPLRGPIAKGFFTEALEAGLRAGSFDLAVHSLKDLPVATPEDLILAAVPRRAPPFDVLLVRDDAYRPEARVLPVRAGARIGASSPRRQSQIRTLRPDAEPAFLRGNVTTRLDRLARGDFDAIVLAEAGLRRLGVPVPAGIIAVRLSLEVWPPAPGQGALAIQCRAADPEAVRRIGALHDPATAHAVALERAWLSRLGGGCSLPFGAWTDGHRWVVGLDTNGAFHIRTGTDVAEAPNAVDELRAGQPGDTIALPIWTPVTLSPLNGLLETA
jgi:hydroxymethylbilane synthase